MTKRNRLAGVDPFSGDDKPESAPTLRDIDAELFGDLARADIGRVEVKPTRIFDIIPDPTQPRRALPSQVRQHWSGSPSTSAEMFGIWLGMVHHERGAEFDLNAHLNLAEIETGITSENPGPLESAFLEVVRLAASIRHEGLANPITVVRAGRNFRLETGERRWLAYHLLYAWEPHDKSQWEKIPARIMEEFSVWRQAAENNARANLNAIAKARQLAVLMMDLYNRQGVAFKNIEEMLSAGYSERHFYAQVEDGNIYRVPKGSSEQLVMAMGLKHPRQLSYYRVLLKLPDEAWRIADDYSLTENLLRECRERAGEDGELLTQLIAQAAINQDSSGTTVLVSETTKSDLSKKTEQKKSNPHALVNPQESRRIGSFVRFASRLNQSDLSRLESKKKHEMQQTISWLRGLLDQIEGALHDGE